MKLMVDIGHPAHVHFFKNMIWELERKGFSIKITAKQKENAQQLLDIYGFKYSAYKYQSGLLRKAYGVIKNDLLLYKIAKKFKPDALISMSSPYAAHVSRVLGKPHIAFTDTEYASLIMKLTFPFTDVICTPSCFKRDLGHKQVRFNGYKELAYLHPKYFKPDIEVLEDVGLTKTDAFIILRFVSWNASHDIGLSGIKKGTEMKFIKSLEQYGKVFISSEKKMNADLDSYSLPISPEKIHSLMSFARLYIGEGGTMATESAILGTPSIHIESANLEKPSAASIFCGNFIELRDKYDLLYMFTDQERALEKAISILEDKNSKQKWQIKKDKLIKDKEDVTKFMVKMVEKYV